jgi:hypothetical protein
MVIERNIIQYICMYCQKAYLVREDAEKCERFCDRFTNSLGLDKLSLSLRTLIHFIEQKFIQ